MRDKPTASANTTAAAKRPVRVAFPRSWPSHHANIGSTAAASMLWPLMPVKSSARLPIPHPRKATLVAKTSRTAQPIQTAAAAPRCPSG